MRGSFARITDSDNLFAFTGGNTILVQLKNDGSTDPNATAGAIWIPQDADYLFLGNSTSYDCNANESVRISTVVTNTGVLILIGENTKMTPGYLKTIGIKYDYQTEGLVPSFYYSNVSCTGSCNVLSWPTTPVTTDYITDRGSLLESIDRDTAVIGYAQTPAKTE